MFQFMELGCLRDIEQDVCVGAWLREAGARGGPGTGHVSVGPAAHWNPEPPPWGWLPGTGAPVLPFTEPFMYTPCSVTGSLSQLQRPHYTHQEAEIRETLSHLPVVTWLANDEGEGEGPPPGLTPPNPASGAPCRPTQPSPRPH